MKIKFYSFEPTPLHVSGKCSSAVWPAEYLEDVWDIFCDVLGEFENVQSVSTHAFVLMRNHYHWLCAPKHGSKRARATAGVDMGASVGAGAGTGVDVDAGVGVDADLDGGVDFDLFEWFHEAITLDFVHSLQMEYIFETGGSAPDPLFEGPPKIIELDHIQAYRNTYAYIYRNPVTAGIVERAEHYPFSSLPYVLGRMSETLNFQCWDQMNVIYDPVRVLRFINESSLVQDSFVDI